MVATNATLVYAELKANRFDFEGGHEAAERNGGVIVSERFDLNRVVMVTYRIDTPTHRYHYVWRSGPLGYQWHIIPA